MADEWIIDCDVHHARGSDEELLDYLSRPWREYVLGPGPTGIVPLTVSDGYPNPHGFMRADSYPERGGPPGSDLETMDRQLLAANKVSRAVLTYGDDMHVSGHHNPYFATELARALNDWTIERWLAVDERLVSSIIVACQLPEQAAAEVRRHADNPRMVQVMLADNPSKHGFGHPIFHPLYEAAVETGRPVAIHAGANDWANPPSTGGGTASTYLEVHTLWPQAIMTHFVSLVAHGVFEKYRELKLVLIEGGSAWIPSLLWRFDTEYKGLRREAPWLRRLPSEYFQEHVWVTSQPLELSPEREQIVELLRWFDAENKLIFASDYPHWDADELAYLQGRLPVSWHDRIFRENAMRLYGWTEADLPLPRLEATA
jgi:predicted TIM-barrel fold metal-dependent hydrolase